jgi:hypothetical protein
MMELTLKAESCSMRLAIYGTTPVSNQYNPVVYQLNHTNQGWAETILHVFADEYVQGGVIFGGAGVLFGTTFNSVYQLSLAGGTWNYNPLYVFSGVPELWSTVTRGPDGDLYGATCDGGSHLAGSVFKLTLSQGGWLETDLYDFRGGIDGACPTGGMALDANGNLFGTATDGGTGGCGFQGCGVVWEITP